MMRHVASNRRLTRSRRKCYLCLRYKPAIRVVLYHELAHSLLRLWELPGYDNEDLADEFAVLHAGDSPKAIEQISRWFESRNPLQKAATQVQMAGAHAPSALRAKRARAGLTNRAQLRVKWDALLAPYRRIP